VLRVQPDEAIYLKINNKVPGLGMRLDRSDLNLLYSARYIVWVPWLEIVPKLNHLQMWLKIKTC
jgi:hypothetical protein